MTRTMLAAALLLVGLTGCSMFGGRDPKTDAMAGTPAMAAAVPPRTAAPVAAPMIAPEPAHKVIDTAQGKVLATNRGMTLYIYAQDMMPGTSTCVDSCAASWPPLLALDDATP